MRLKTTRNIHENCPILPLTNHATLTRTLQAEIWRCDENSAVQRLRRHRLQSEPHYPEAMGAVKPRQRSDAPENAIDHEYRR